MLSKDYWVDLFEDFAASGMRVSADMGAAKGTDMLGKKGK
jgi:hypothetical protein